MANMAVGQYARDIQQAQQNDKALQELEAAAKSGSLMAALGVVTVKITNAKIGELMSLANQVDQASAAAKADKLGTSSHNETLLSTQLQIKTAALTTAMNAMDNALNKLGEGEAKLSDGQ